MSKKGKSTSGKVHGHPKNKDSGSATGKKVRSRRSVLVKPAYKARGKHGSRGSKLASTGKHVGINGTTKGTTEGNASHT